jgi:hypothetical protein
LSSESYTTKAAAEGGMASVKENGPKHKRYERKVAKNGHQRDVFLGSSEGRRYRLREEDAPAASLEDKT